MRNRLKIICMYIILILNNAFGVICPKLDNAPTCPTTGSVLLDETYPTQAFVISNSPQGKGLQSSKVTTEYINAIAKNYDYENIPQIFVPVMTDLDFDKIILSVKSKLEKNKIDPEKIKNVISQISHVKSESYTWQQDYFESFVDLETGKPVLREFQSYLQSRPEVKGAVEEIQQLGKNCQITKGKYLESFHSKNPSDIKDVSFGNGEMGGNIEGAPGGFCLIGDNQSKRLTTQYCGNEENIIQLQTSWLNVGHVDEIFKIIPSKFNDGRPSECQFSLMSASPKKAFELMSNSTSKTRPFYSFSSKLNSDELKEVRVSRSIDNGHTYGNKLICDYIFNSLKSGKFIPNNKKDQNNIFKARSVFINLIIGNAFANLTKNETKCEDYIDKIPNEIIEESIRNDNDLFNLNMAIQDSIEKDKQLIKSKIVSRLPQCEKYFDFLDVPDLFYGSPAIEKNGKLELPKPSDVKSFLPNPTNSVLMNRTILLPESANPAFDTYVEEELRKRKINTDKIDTWDYAHIGEGNIHCSSHSIPYCKPR